MPPFSHTHPLLDERKYCGKHAAGSVIYYLPCTHLAMEDAPAQSTPHVVIFTFDEHGHITPAFALGRALAGRGIHVTGVLTASRYANSLTKPVETALFRIVTIPDSSPQDDDGSSKQDDVCYQHSFQKLERGFEELMLRLQPPATCLISDGLYPWTQDLAERFGIPRYHIWFCSALTTLVLSYTPELFAKGLLPFQPGMEEERLDFLPGFPKEFRLGDIPLSLSSDLKLLDILLNIVKGLKRAAGAVINTVYELESQTVDALGAAEGVGFKSVYALGSMSSLVVEGAGDGCNGGGAVSNNGGAANGTSGKDDESVLQWLDTQPKASVVYVALGSVVTLTEEEIEEMAWGLEACGQPFLWVLRRTGQGKSAAAFGTGVAAEENMPEGLPAGFLQRNAQRGRVVAWAPQTAVLAHASVGCYVTHCGFGSLQEALAAGVPMIGGFCKVADNTTNLRLLTHYWGAAIPLQEPHVSPPLPIRSSLVSCVKEVFHGEKGRVLYTNVAKIKAAMNQAVSPPDGSSYFNLAKFADVILDYSKTSAPS